ncbi:MAG: NADH dehydrogenase [Oscillospiraceae bacterium]|nr:NADH dehydrogenase [Oscillospiraceae bacterium]
MLLAPLSWLLGRRSRFLRDRFVEAAGLTELALAFFAACSGGSAAIPALCGMGFSFELDGFRQLYSLIFAFMWAMTLLFSPYYFAHHHHRNRYYFFQLLTLGGTMGVFLAADLYTSFVFFEIMSFTSFAWVIQEETEGAIRAAKTYLAVAVIGGLVALMGLFLLWNRLGTLTISALYPAAKAAGKLPLLYTAGGCILFGYGAKAGVFPLHIWLPKAHPVAPAPASALLSGALTKTGVWGILVLSCQLFRGDPAWGTLILCLGAVTMLLGAVLALFSVDFKRTLACSSMSQIGFILTGVGTMGLLGEENALAARGVVLHMSNHSLFKLLLFLCAGVIFRNLHALNLNDIRGFGKKKPFLKLCFLVGALGIGGIPLFSGYVSKTLLHEGIVEAAQQYGWALRLTEWIFLISGGLTLAYMTKLFVAVFVEPHPIRQAEFDGMRKYLNRPAALSLGLAALPIPILGVFPGRTMDAIAELGMDFLHGETLPHAVSYFSLENLKGAGISLLIGAGVYLLIVRSWMRKDGSYVDRWQKKLDLEELVYRPLLLKLLPAVFGWLSALFGENRITEPLARGSLRVMKTLSHACADSADALVLALRRTVLRQSPEPPENEMMASAAYRLGARLDRTSRRSGKGGGEDSGLLLYRVQKTLQEAGRLIRSNLSFGLLMLALGICVVLVWLLVPLL